MNCYSPNFQGFILKKNAINNQVGMLGDMFLWLVANLKQGVIYFIKQACGNEMMPSVYILNVTPSGSFWALGDTQHDLSFLTFIVMFVDTYASWHIISVIILPKSGEGN